MTIQGTVLGAIILSAVSMSCLSKPAIDYLEAEPPAGTVRYGKIVYVDDGTCPAGEVKEVTGGSKEKSIPRKVRCVKRPS